MKIANSATKAIHTDIQNVTHYTVYNTVSINNIYIATNHKRLCKDSKPKLFSHHPFDLHSAKSGYRCN